MILMNPAMTADPERFKHAIDFKNEHHIRQLHLFVNKNHPKLVAKLGVIFY